MLEPCEFCSSYKDSMNIPGHLNKYICESCYDIIVKESLTQDHVWAEELCNDETNYVCDYCLSCEPKYFDISKVTLIRVCYSCALTLEDSIRKDLINLSWSGVLKSSSDLEKYKLINSNLGELKSNLNVFKQKAYNQKKKIEEFRVKMHDRVEKSFLNAASDITDYKKYISKVLETIPNNIKQALINEKSSKYVKLLKSNKRQSFFEQSLVTLQILDLESLEYQLDKMTCLKSLDLNELIKE
ncbi:hypothetical protein SteCoe_12569 [Stentor coeruleus]|uniref:Uncharacterized protein n=1 Tax=Stentor coeruleus TaxID=5963 RepID=A0A1R2CAH2_9CILI|nr:hypothetical protein SteCoe_12569 [Stentor coeruleus]